MGSSRKIAILCYFITTSFVNLRFNTSERIVLTCYTYHNIFFPEATAPLNADLQRKVANVENRNSWACHSVVYHTLDYNKHWQARHFEETKHKNGSLFSQNKTKWTELDYNSHSYHLGKAQLHHAHIWHHISRPVSKTSTLWLLGILFQVLHHLHRCHLGWLTAKDAQCWLAPLTATLI